ncbi:30S ribosomal protein S1 [Spirochaetes bacterium]|uniref:30S ribosomal protein S1 n=1 Tax=Candidatus Scatousia excrementipullorum TaxID=2840936 RepID=A0A9D9DRU7_9BACT|nr:30S ribosomal protein S1 [Candidatus Scatousia excrementipullorum]
MTSSELDFEELLKQYDYKFQKGDLVKGIVCGYDSQGVMVDIGAKTIAVVPSREAVEKDEKVEDKFEKGKEYEFLIIREEDEDGKFLLSKKKVDFAYAWKELEKAKAADETILGTIAGIVKGGVLVEISGVRGFVPSSQLRSKETDLEVGSKIELKILTLDSQQNNFILSNKKVYEDSAVEARKNVFSQIEPGQIVKGDVVRITDFGAFIDLGGIDGLLPLSQLSWRWIDHPTDILKVGDKIDVEVIAVDHDKQRVSLSLKNLEPDPWVEAEKQIKEGDKVEGTITRIKHFGAFVEVFPGVEALLPHNEVVELQNQSGNILQVGDKIMTYILKFNPTDKRIALTVTEPNTTEISAE